MRLTDHLAGVGTAENKRIGILGVPAMLISKRTRLPIVAVRGKPEAMLVIAPRSRGLTQPETLEHEICGWDSG